VVTFVKIGVTTSLFLYITASLVTSVYAWVGPFADNIFILIQIVYGLFLVALSGLFYFFGRQVDRRVKEYEDKRESGELDESKRGGF
jgi:hypothetical protein